jgi:hypothetical protein
MTRGLGVTPSGSGHSASPEPVVSALRASVPNAAALADELESLIAKSTDEDLDDRGRYFRETYNDLTQCSHGETGEYGNPSDGRLIEFLWNNRRTFVTALLASVDRSPKGQDAKRLDRNDESAVRDSADAQDQSHEPQ